MAFPRLISKLFDVEGDSAKLKPEVLPMAYIRDEYRREVEKASSGRNTVVRDKNGNPHIMVVIPRFNLQDIDASLGTGTHPAFIVNGVTKSELLIGKFLASQGSDGLAATVPHAAPWVRINFDNALAACRALGTGFGLCSNAAYAARMLWLWKQFGADHQYLGNTNWGRNHTYTHQTGTMQDTSFAPGDTGNNTTAGAATLTGTGPVEWNDDATPWGISDLVGNVWEWTSGLRLNEGEYQVIPDNNAMMSSTDHSASSAAWKAILQNGSLVAPGTANTLKLNAPKTGDGSNASVGAPTVNTTIANKLTGNNYASCWFYALAGASGVTIPNIMRSLRLAPVSADNSLQGHFWARNHGERLPIRGGNWHDGANAGPSALSLNNARSHAYWSLGFRAAFLS